MRVAGHISSSKKEVKEKDVCSGCLSEKSKERILNIFEEGFPGSECMLIQFPGITNW